MEETLVVANVEVGSETRAVFLASSKTSCDVDEERDQVGARAVEMR